MSGTGDSGNALTAVGFPDVTGKCKSGTKQAIFTWFGKPLEYRVRYWRQRRKLHRYIMKKISQIK